MSDDGGEPPSENGPKFRFLKRGTGSQKFQKINYMRRKSSDGESVAPRPSATSVSSEAPSTSTAVGFDTETPCPASVPQLNLEALAAPERQQLTDRDSGRESAVPMNQELIHSAPPSGRVDSGFGDYRNIVLSPNQSHFTDERTFVNDQDETTFIQSHPSQLAVPTVTEENDEVFSDDHHNSSIRQVNESMKSFLQNEAAMGRSEPDGESQLSTPTRNLLAGIGNRVPSTSGSQSSGSSDQYQPGGPLCSTPIQELSLQPTLPPRRHVASVVNFETPILRGFNHPGSSSNSGGSARPPSTATTGSRSLSTPTASFQIEGSSQNDYIRNEQLVHEQVQRQDASIAQNHRSPVVPRRIEHPSASSEDELRRVAIRNNAVARNVPINKPILDSLTSSDETPLRKRLPQTKDPVVKELRKQLRATIAHLDLAMAHMHDQEKKLRAIYNKKHAELHNREVEISEERARLMEEKNKFGMDRHEWQLEQKRRQVAYQKDREALIQREEAHRKQMEIVEKDCKDQTLAAKTGAASLRVNLNAKEQEIKKMKADNEKILNSKTRLEKLLDQVKTNHNRELKKKNDRITELEKQLTTHESQAARRRNGIQPRPKPASQLPSTNASLPDITFTEPEPIYEDVADENPLRRQVRFDLDANQYQEFSSFSSTDLTEGMVEQPAITGLSMGLCRPFVDSWNRTTYMYEIHHSDGVACGARLFKFHTNNSAWLYGPVEVFLYHRFPLVVKIPAIDLELRVLMDQVEVHRPHLEISRFDLKQAVVTDTRRRKDGSGFYAIRTQVGRSCCEVIGQSDRDKCEDEIVLRRGSLREPREYMKILEGGSVWWQSGAVRSPDLSDWLMVTEPDGKTKIRVSFNDESIDIFASPSEDLVLMRHKYAENKRAPCCDIGKASRDRERNGEFVAFGKELLTRFM